MLRLDIQHLAMKSTDVQLGPLISSQIRRQNSLLCSPMLITLHCTRDAIYICIFNDISRLFRRYQRTVFINSGTKFTSLFNEFIRRVITIRPVLSRTHSPFAWKAHELKNDRADKAAVAHVPAISGRSGTKNKFPGQLYRWMYQARSIKLESKIQDNVFFFQINENKNDNTDKIKIILSSLLYI